MRDSNHFIMDLMSFPKAVDATNTADSNTDSAMATDLGFHNALFTTDTTGPQQTHNHNENNRQNHEPPKSRVETDNVYMPLNEDYLLPVTKAYNGNSAVDGVTDVVHDSGVKVVRQLILNGTNETLDVRQPTNTMYNII